ncbi:probable lipid II flippase MurJ isoform X2 [Phoenix dactylifera]|uniref:Probable lipid II flippase MurJ isoform X2 n=1 Tax=Phoenix dactylifera TaxID=42345 RepID=A0A8B9ASE3_PHODC|nr:probable lipid II flippase MurJ isoform X2 [Phoenix dactylifera]
MALAKPSGLYPCTRSLPQAKTRSFPSLLQPKLHPSPNPSLKPFDATPGLSLVSSSAPVLHLRPRRGFRAPPRASSDPSPLEESPQKDATSEYGLLRRATLVGTATVASKILGLLREIVLAAVIGVGPVATAFNHAAVLPRFSSSFLGGVNGPIHITVATTLSKLSKESRRQLTRKMLNIMFLIGGAFSALTYIYADEIISLTAPGLQVLAQGNLIREMAMNQLKLMTPCILVSGSMAVGFGCLTSEGENTYLALSPSITSIAVIASCAVYILMKGSSSSSLNSPLLGVFISSGASVGSLMQWIIQVMIHKNSERETKFISWMDFFNDKDVHKLFALMLPATLSSGLVQITSLTDLYFSSFIPGAAAGLSYAHLLTMAPLGIFSSTLILPLLPTFSRHTKPSSLASLKENLQKAIVLCMVIILPITCTSCVLAGPVISLLFQRFKFDSSASSFVSSLLLCYSIGSPLWIVRELCAVVFYSLGDGNCPLLINLIAIFMNGILDWLSLSVFGLGAQGLALSTSCVSALSVLALLLLLSNKLGGIINIRDMRGPFLLLLICCAISGFTAMFSYRMLQFFLSTISILRLFGLTELLSILLAGILGMSAFYLPLVFAKFAGVFLVDSLWTTLLNR